MLNEAENSLVQNSHWKKNTWIKVLLLTGMVEFRTQI